MAPLTPHWTQPSHPAIQEVILGGEGEEFTSKSLSRVAVPPFGLFAKMAFPPCTLVDKDAGPTYATVQIGRDQHLNLNSDLLYINHSCEPSVIFDTANLSVIAGPKGLKPGDELTFFYPSTEWAMAQPFDCLCGTPSCRGRISGAKDMTPAQLAGTWLNGHIREMLEEQNQQLQQQQQQQQRQRAAADLTIGGGIMTAPDDPTAEALRDALQHAEKVVTAARYALLSYAGSPHSAAASAVPRAYGGGSGYDRNCDGTTAAQRAFAAVAGAARRGPTSRELSGEMGGDTILAGAF